MTLNVASYAAGPALFAVSLRFTGSYRAALTLCLLTMVSLTAVIKQAHPPLRPTSGR